MQRIRADDGMVLCKEIAKRTVNANELQADLSELLDCVERGESIIITRYGVPLAVLVPTEETRRIRHAKLIEEWRELRKGITLRPDLIIRQLIDEGWKR